ncbi:MAG: T9SS type A sorting domain-containing protein, partial [Candidatus Delongbacteria bacterium]|nr:T9SS type A sorting domain-containing protein [Candidatus Delongbacteria bacterium]
RLPDIYVKANELLEPLIRTYDEALASDSTSNKKFFKEMKVSTKIKGKKYDEAIVLAEEMRDEATTDGERILAEIDIAIANMMKHATSKGKSKDYMKIINGLLAKLIEDESEEKSENSNLETAILPTRFELLQNYPNPFNPVTTIKYALPYDSNVNLRIYNSEGKQVAELTNSRINAGYHSIQFDASKYSSGVFYYQLKVDGNVKMSKKMLMIK